MIKIKYSDWKIRTKILTGFIVLIILLIIISTFSYLTIYGLHERRIPLLLDNEEISHLALEMRNNEKDFFLKYAANIIFFSTGKSQHLNHFNEAYIHMKDLFIKLEENK